MKTVFGDFETFYSDDYSLRKMTAVEYVLDPRFEANGCAFKEGIDGTPFWVDGPDLQAYFDSLDASDTIFVTHNALFDMCVAAWRFNFVPRLMVDTLGVSRAVLGYLLKYHSLESVSEYLGLGAKGKTLLKVKGMNLAAIKAAGLYDEYVAYGLDDVTKCAGIYDKLVRSGRFPPRELVVMDMVLRCAIEPKFTLDQHVLAEHLAHVRAEKEHQLALAMLVGADGKSDLMSNEKFAELLRGVGVEPPMKTSPATGKQTYAFAKSDPEFIALEEDPNPAVQALVAARLGHKSTLEETRCERLLKISQLRWPVTPQGNMPVPLAYGAAHTHRLGGTWKLNLQNLPRRSKLRSALTGPAVVVVDASQIEARIVAWICGQTDLVEQFARGEDVYAAFASDNFGRPIIKKENPNERFVGKVGILQLGFGAGWPKYQGSVKITSRQELGYEIALTDGEASKTVYTYRSRYARIPATWARLQHEGIPALADGTPFSIGPCVFEKEAILLPNGLRLHYHNLRYEAGEWVFTYGGILKRIYGGKLLENIVQALARIITMDAGIRIQSRSDAPEPLRLGLQAHDELVYVPRRADHAGVLQGILIEEMTRRPHWAPDLPLAAEADFGSNYGEAK